MDEMEWNIGLSIAEDIRFRFGGTASLYPLSEKQRDNRGVVTVECRCHYFM